MKFSKRRRLC